MGNDELISRAGLLAGIEELKESPWYNYGKYDGDFDDLTVSSMIDMIKYSERKEAIAVIIEQCIEKETAVEVEPVKHGRWELITQNKFTGTKTLRCTYCKNYFVIRDDTLNAGRGDANFCPNCGSKNRMDGDKDNNVRNLTDEETAIYESWIQSEAKDTALNIMDGDGE